MTKSAAIVLAAVMGFGPAAAQEPAGPLADLDVLVGRWQGSGPGFTTELQYRWVIVDRVLEVSNEVRGTAGGVIARYHGSYAWDGGREEIAFLTAGGGGEVHRGRAWWRDGVLWHEAEVSGGGVQAYASAVRPADGRLEYFADYGTATATRELLQGDPIVYEGVTSAVGGVPRARVLLLGTFHFDDPGLDDYVPQFAWDARTAEHQSEIARVVEQLGRYAPTRIALEWPASRQATLDSLYEAYRTGGAEPSADERQQLGFRVAHQLGHERVYAVDAQGRSYTPELTQEEYEARVARLSAAADPAIVAAQRGIELRYRRQHRTDDSLKTVMRLEDYLVRRNEEAALLESHGEYLIGGFHLGSGDDYLGPDMRTRWYNRNLRIFHNLRRITRSADERLLVIIGAGHVPILRHAVEASPEYELVEVSAYLAGAGR